MEDDDALPIYKTLQFLVQKRPSNTHILTIEGIQFQSRRFAAVDFHPRPNERSGEVG